MDERRLQFINSIFYQDVKKIKTPDAGKFCEEFCLIFSEFIFTTFGFYEFLVLKTQLLPENKKNFFAGRLSVADRLLHRES